MRCLLAAIRCEKGDVAGNLSSHLRLVAQAAAAQCELAQVFAAAGRVAGVQRKRHLGDGEEAFTPAAGSAVFEHARRHRPRQSWR